MVPRIARSWLILTVSTTEILGRYSFPKKIFMKFFQQSFLPDPLGSILAKARKHKGLSLPAAAKSAGISVPVAEALERDFPLDPSTARLHAVTYARSLGLDPSEIRDSLPALRELVTGGQRYLSRMARPAESRWRSPMGELYRILAPMGRAALYLLMVATLLISWGIGRQLSRIRSIPWITSNSQPSSFTPR